MEDDLEFPILLPLSLRCWVRSFSFHSRLTFARIILKLKIKIKKKKKVDSQAVEIYSVHVVVPERWNSCLHPQCSLRPSRPLPLPFLHSQWRCPTQPGCGGSQKLSSELLSGLPGAELMERDRRRVDGTEGRAQFGLLSYLASRARHVRKGSGHTPLLALVITSSAGMLSHS